MRKFIALGTLLLTLAGCSASATASELEKVSTVQTATADSSGFDLILDKLDKISNTQKVKTKIKELRTHVGHTWYVFSGASPAGWDCSGLVMWFYDEFGVTLEHRASKQAKSGELVSSPKMGDIVSFNHRGYESAFHVGIYIGAGKMIHAGGGPGERTAIVDISEWGKLNWNTEIKYTRIIETR